MSAPKSLTSHEKKALIKVKNDNDWTMTELADLIGVGERSLSRYLYNNTPPRNNQRGLATYKKIKDLIKGVKISKKDPSAFKIRKGTRQGTFLTGEETTAITAWKDKYSVSFLSMAKELGCSSSHLSQIVHREVKTSEELRKKILEMISEPLAFQISYHKNHSDETSSDHPHVPTPSESTEIKDPSSFVDEQDVYTHQFRLRDDYTVNLTLPKNLSEIESDRLALFIKSLVM